MRLIRKQDLPETQIQKITFGGGADCAAKPEPPAWMQAAATLRKQEGESSPFDSPLAEKTAFENGLRLGQQAALEIAEKKLEAVMKRYADAIIEVGRLKPALYRQVEREVVKLALEVAKKIVHREVRADREIIQTLVRVALSRAAGKSPATVRLHPADHAFMLERRAAAAQPGENAQDLVLLPDNSVEQGGCFIEAECGDIDARIEEQFREVERVFFSSGE